MVYSAYEDYNAVRAYLNSSQAPVEHAVIQGNSEIVTLNVTVPNKGLYTLDVTVSCTSPDSNIVCEPSSVSVPAGQQGVLNFRMTVVDLQLYTAAGNPRINGTISIALEPFVSLSVETNFGAQGGG